MQERLAPVEKGERIFSLPLLCLGKGLRCFLEPPEPVERIAFACIAPGIVAIVFERPVERNDGILETGKPG